MKYTDIQDKLPQWLQELIEEIHKYVPKFKKRVKNAYTEGLDFESIRRSIMIHMLESTLDNFDHNKYPDVFNCITRVIELYRTNEQDRGKWEEAQDAADAAGAAAGAAEETAWAAWAAYYAALAAWAAWSAAWAAGTAWIAEGTAGEGAYGAYKSFGDKLIELMKPSSNFIGSVQPVVSPHLWTYIPISDTDIRWNPKIQYVPVSDTGNKNPDHKVKWNCYSQATRYWTMSNLLTDQKGNQEFRGISIYKNHLYPFYRFETNQGQCGDFGTFQEADEYAYKYLYTFEGDTYE